MAEQPKFVHPGKCNYGFRTEDEQNLFTYHNGAITHKLSKDGFRSTRLCELHPNKEQLQILAIGCSYVFGLGLEEKETWPEQFGKLIERTFAIKPTVFNLAVPGASNDYVLRQIVEGLEYLKPTILLVGFTQKERREYWRSNQTNYSIRPGANLNPKWGERRVAVQKQFEQLNSRSNEFNRLYHAVRVASGFAKLAKSFLLYTYSSVRETPYIQQWLNEEGYIGFPFPKIDYAIDDAHPGPRSNELLALKTLTRMCNRLQVPDASNLRLRKALGVNIKKITLGPQSQLISKNPF